MSTLDIDDYHNVRWYNQLLIEKVLFQLCRLKIFSIINYYLPSWYICRIVALNGKALMMVNDFTLPDIIPVKQNANHGVKLPATTFGFFVFPNANIQACLG